MAPLETKGNASRSGCANPGEARADRHGCSYRTVSGLVKAKVLPATWKTALGFVENSAERLVGTNGRNPEWDSARRVGVVMRQQPGGGPERSTPAPWGTVAKKTPLRGMESNGPP